MAAAETLEVVRHHIADERPTIVMLHEALGSVSHWRSFPLQLAEATRCNVVAYSRKGHGQSAGEAAYRTVEYFRQQATIDLPELLDYLNVPRPILFAHSEGASMSLLFAAAFPERPLAVIVEAPILAAGPELAGGLDQAYKAYQEGRLRVALQRHHRDADRVFYSWSDAWRGRPESHTFTLGSYLDGIRCPLLLIRGERDEFGGREAQELLLEKAPQTEVRLLAGVGHTPHREQPAVVLPETAAFLTRHGL